MMLVIASLLLTLGLPSPAADPFAKVPAIVWHAPDDLADVWRVVRRLEGGGATRVREYAKRGLEWSACAGLVDLRTLASAQSAGFAWQDDVARREWARPALARVLIAAHEVWRARHPAQAIGIGDVAQAGCGQIDPGTLTRWVVGDEARALASMALPVAGVPTVSDTTVDSAGKRVLSERRVVGRDTSVDAASPRLFVHLRRYRELPGPAASDIEDKVRAVLWGGELAIETEGVNAAGETEWRQRWVDPKHFRQAIVVVSAKRKPFRLADASDVRLSPWAPARPGEARGERRWTRSATTWQAWGLIEEGAHATHMAGLDADLSYPMKDPWRRFALDPAGIDTAATWDWFVTLYATAEALGTPLDRIVVGGRVLPRLLQEVPGAKTSPLMRNKILTIVGNHDDHHHVRLKRPSAAADTSSAAAIAAP